MIPTELIRGAVLQGWRVRTGWMETGDLSLCTFFIELHKPVAFYKIKFSQTLAALHSAHQKEADAEIPFLAGEV